MRLSLRVSGMTCVNCARAIDLSLKKMRGISNVQVSFELSRVVVDFDQNLIDAEQIIRVIQSLGYRVEEVRGRSIDKEILLLCWFMSLSIMLLMIMHWSLYLQAALALAVQALGGYSFYRGALSSIRAGVGNMDLLVALGSTSALVYSLLSLFNLLPGEPFFETSAFLITFVKSGKFLEDWVRVRALKGLKDLFSLQTLKVKVFKDGMEEERTPVDLFVGDRILLRAGDMVPVDCSVEDGILDVDESLVTGESLPVKKSPGDRLLSGSLVLSGFAKVRVDKSFSGSYANLLVRLVEETLSKKPRVQRLADRFSHYFVLFVLLISLAVFLFWYLSTGDLQRAVNFSLAVLVISCPCAFGIAVPLALTVGLFRAYKKGVLIKDPSVLEKKVDIMVIDKTGTLTEGKPKLVDCRVYQNGALSIAMGMAYTSNHPYSHAIREYCSQRNLKAQELKGCKEEPGVGIFCMDYSLRKSEEGVSLYHNGTKLADFYFEDTLRQEARALVDFLKSEGIDVFLLTGDREEKAIRVARELGIDQFMANARPEDKLSKVEEFRSRGLRVGLIGDGINDAPAMAKADLSFALSSGTDMAKRAGDIVLTRGLEGVKDFFEVQKKTMRRVKENLFWAFVYNLVGIPIAAGILSSAGVHLKPEIAGLMMVFSSLSVVLNSLRK